MNKCYKVSDIFVPGGFPNETYIARDQHQLESRVQEAKENLAKLVVITGMTKSGKTVLVNRVFPREKCIWIDGGSISDEESFWESIIAEVDAYPQVSVTSNRSTDMSVDIDGNLEMGIISKGSIGIEGGISRSSENGITYSRSGSVKFMAIKTLQEKKIPIIIDDFHYITKTIQKNIVRALKVPIMFGLPVIVIAIPNRKYDAVEVEREMTGRIENIEMPTWGRAELNKIAHVGFELLNIRISTEMANDMAEAAYGSPFLMQDFCKALCKNIGIIETQPIMKNISNDIKLEEIYKDIAEHSGRPMFEKLKRGPRARKDRKQRLLKNGKYTDIYGVVMEALKSIVPGTESITYDQLRAGIKEILKDDMPQKNEISRVLDKIAEISYTDESSTPVIDWQREDDQITITDPFFAFFLRWS